MPSRRGMYERHVEAAGHHVHTWECGPDGGRPVVLLHGLLISGKYMLPLARALKRDHHVLVPELPGWGESPPSEEPLTAAELARVLLAWMDEVGVGSAVFVANSFGCQVVAELARIAPGRIERAVLLAPTVDPRAGTTLRQIWHLLRSVPLEDLRLQWRVVKAVFRFGLRHARVALAKAIHYPVEERLAELRVPALLVRGSHDQMSSRAWMERLARRIPGSRLVEVRGAGHAPNWDRPRRIARLVRELSGPPPAEPAR